VQGDESILQCEYCDAHVQLAGVEAKKKKKPQQSRPAASQAPVPPFGPPPTCHVAQPHYSGFAWVVFLIPLMSIAGVAVSVFMSAGLSWGDVELWWYEHVQPGTAYERVAQPEAEAEARVQDDEALDEQETDGEETDGEPEDEDDEPGRVGRLFTELAQRAEEAEAQKNAPRTTRRRPAAPKEPEGPLLTVAQAKSELEPKVLECMKTAKVHHVAARMGNSKVGGVSIITSAGRAAPTRVDGIVVKLATTALGRCINEAGKQVRTQAFGGNTIIIDVRNPAVPNPLGHLPQTPARDALEAAVTALEPELKGCAKKHGEEGKETVITLRIDGPTGKLLSARPVHTKNAFNRCAEAVYGKASFPKAQRHVIDYAHRIRL
jgi:hypothetical protein